MLKYGLFLSSMMGITDGKFCAERSAGCRMVQLGAYLAEPTASQTEKGDQSGFFLPADWDSCTQFLAEQCNAARSLNDVMICLNLATPRLEWGVKAARCFKQAGGDFVELNVHGGYQRYLEQGKLRAMILPENQSELFRWVNAFSNLDIPLIVKLNGQFDRPHFIQTLEKMKNFSLYGLHVNIRHPSQKPDLALIKQVRVLHDGLLLVSGNIRSGTDAYSAFIAGADMVGIAEPTIADADYIRNCLKQLGIDRSQRVLFDEVADLYNEARPGYPDVLIDDIIDLSGIPSGGRILEIGTGPGNATLPFARRGYSILGIEIGENLAALATKNCSKYPGVNILNTAFEDWVVEENAFDLAISAQALHWIPPHIAYPKIAKTLKGTGSVAFFWRVTVDPQTEWSKSIDASFQEMAPEIKSPYKGNSTLDWTVNVITNNFKSIGGFEQVQYKTYKCNEKLTSDLFIKRLQTSPSYHLLDTEMRCNLENSLCSIIESQGGVVIEPQLLIVFYAKAKGDT
jgi:SAM-dependent methyltransferase